MLRYMFVFGLLGSGIYLYGMEINRRDFLEIPDPSRDGIVVDLDELEDLEVPDIIKFITPHLPEHSVYISPEERNKYLETVLKKYEVKKSDDYKKLTQSIRSMRSNSRAVPLNVDISTIHSTTTYIARKLLEKENTVLSTKVLTEEERRKAAEKTEMRVKIVSGVATGMVFTAFILAQILPSVL